MPSELLLAISTCWLWHTIPLAPLLVLNWQPPQTAKHVPENTGVLGAFMLLRLHPASRLTAGHLVALQGQCVDYHSDQLANSSTGWKLPRERHILARRGYQGSETS